jgi:putative ABC transport system substrate-binding protein
MIGRRGFIGAVAGVHLAIPQASMAQPVGKVPRIGWLGFNAPETAPHQYAAFRQGLRDHGWVEGRNILIEYRWAGGRADRLPALAAELVRLDVDLLVTASSASTRAAKDATTAHSDFKRPRERLGRFCATAIDPFQTIGIVGQATASFVGQ